MYERTASLTTQSRNERFKFQNMTWICNECLQTSQWVSILFSSFKGSKKSLRDFQLLLKSSWRGVCFLNTRGI